LRVATVFHRFACALSVWLQFTIVASLQYEIRRSPAAGEGREPGIHGEWKPRPPNVDSTL